MEEKKAPESVITWDKCSLCGCPDTVARKFVTEEVRKKAGWGDAFVSLEKVVTPLFNPMSPPVIAANSILSHYDVCAKCGFRYCTKAEIVSVPVTYEASKLKGHGFPQQRPGLS